MSGSSGTTGGGSTIDPQIRDAIISNYNFGSNLSNQPYQPYTGQTIAAPSATTQMAENAGINMYNTGANALGTTLSNIGQIQAAGAPMIGAAQSNAPTTAITGAANYYNPFENQVVQQTMNDLNTQRQMTQNQTAQAATQARAFGGSRHGVADSLTNAAFAQQAANTAGQLRSQGFNTAMQLGGQDIDRGMSLSGMNAQFQQQANLANQGAQQQQYQTALQAAGMTPGMVNAMYGNVGQLGQIGAQQTARDQAQLDQAYQNFLEARSFPQQQLALRSQALMGGFGGTYQPPQATGQNRWLQAAGLGLAGMSSPLGAAGAGLGLLAFL